MYKGEWRNAYIMMFFFVYNLLYTRNRQNF